MLIDFWTEAAWRPSGSYSSPGWRQERWRLKYLIERRQLRLRNKGIVTQSQHKLERQKLRRKHDHHFRMSSALKSRLAHALKRKSGIKAAKTVELIGCSIQFLCAHLESQFRSGMSWDNYGKWHIDHKKPCADFDLRRAEQQRECFHFSNLQPLWALDNIRKGRKILKNET